MQIAIVSSQSLAAIILLGPQVFGRQIIANLVMRPQQRTGNG
jgi:hypothetical protein